ncbi:MAG: GNAT family N-acetyltransferase, partial [Thermogemmatispora sp.]
MSALLHGLNLTTGNPTDRLGVLQLSTVCGYQLCNAAAEKATLLTAEENWLVRSGCGESIAYADLHTHRVGGETSGSVGLICLLRLLVHPCYRRRGLATLLLRLAEEKARQLAGVWSPLPGPDKPEWGLLCIPVLPGQDNYAAQVFLKREGYSLLPGAGADYWDWPVPPSLPMRAGQSLL